MNVLLIEDDPAIAKSLLQGFREAGHEVTWAKDGDRGAEEAAKMQADVIILDLLLPGRPGLQVLADIRSSGARTPIIALTALGAVDDRVTGLNAGADDYVVKPFDFAELLARVEAVCRRSTSKPEMVLKTGSLRLNLSTRRAEQNGREVDLTPTELSLLELLMRHAGQVVTRRMLCEHLWGFDWNGTTNVIEVHINHLRRKFDVNGDESIIRTVRGRGYALRAD
jgi:two-component system OmpR family response regulator/two-component system copper resistance phosphate regulon response regulator CusR